MKFKVVEMNGIDSFEKVEVIDHTTIEGTSLPVRRSGVDPDKITCIECEGFSLHIHATTTRMLHPGDSTRLPIGGRLTIKSQSGGNLVLERIE